MEDPEQFREDVISGLDNWTEIRELIQDQLKNKHAVKEYYTPLNRFDLVRNAEFLLGGSPAVLKATNWTIRRILNQQERLDRLMAAVKK